MKSAVLFLNLVILAAGHAHVLSNQERLDRIENLTRIAIGSCNKQGDRQTLWNDLSRNAPDLFIWGGDNVYADSPNPADLAIAYQQQNAVKEYQKFKSKVPITGTWDDHDYGANNSGHEYSIKRISQKFLLDFLEEPKDSKRRFQEGIYTSYIFGESGKRIKIIILDNRYFKDEDINTPMLGNAQWQWLEKELSDRNVDLFFVVSGLSILSPLAPASEEWADYPGEKARLRKLMKAAGRPYLYLTGDKHFSSVFPQGDELEFLVSGMTHNTRVAWRPYIRYLYPNHVFKHNYGLIDVSWNESHLPVLDLSVKSAIGDDYLKKRIEWTDGRWVQHGKK